MSKYSVQSLGLLAREYAKDTNEIYGFLKWIDCRIENKQQQQNISKKITRTFKKKPKLNSKQINEYSRRNKFVKEMGYDDYDDYLNSDLWRSIRGSILIKANHKCEVCESLSKLHIHHARYTNENLKGTTFRDMYVLCNKCHEAAHDVKGKNSILTTTNRIIKNHARLHRSKTSQASIRLETTSRS